VPTMKPQLYGTPVGVTEPDNFAHILYGDFLLRKVSPRVLCLAEDFAHERTKVKSVLSTFTQR